LWDIQLFNRIVDFRVADKSAVAEVGLALIPGRSPVSYFGPSGSSRACGILFDTMLDIFKGDVEPKSDAGVVAAALRAGRLGAGLS
jgi:hypothetical protein